MIDQNRGSDIDERHKCSFYLLRDFYVNMKIVLDREVKVANFFVERVHRAPWNVCDQYISSIIEVLIIIIIIIIIIDIYIIIIIMNRKRIE